MGINIREKAGGVTIECRVTPRAGRSRIKGVREGVLEVSLDSPPVEGKANKALIEFLARLLRTSKSRISIIAGERSRKKVVLVEGISASEFIKILSDKALF